MLLGQIVINDAFVENVHYESISKEAQMLADLAARSSQSTPAPPRVNRCYGHLQQFSRLADREDWRKFLRPMRFDERQADVSTANSQVVLPPEMGHNDAASRTDRMHDRAVN
jgi:hypothetical protein